MSQERTRFPIQPKDVRRSARSNKEVAADGQMGNARKRSADKPTIPPHRRHEQEADAED